MYGWIGERNVRSYYRGADYLTQNTLLIAVIALLTFNDVYATAAITDRENIRSAGLSITSEGTRERLAVGTSFGVSGTITNNTKSLVYVNERFATLKVPAEIEGPYGNADSIWFAYFPTGDHGQNDELTFKATVALKPGEATSVFWLVDPRTTLSEVAWQRPKLQPNTWTTLKNLYDQVSIELNFLLFSPGKYKLTLSVDYWDNVGLKGPPNLAIESKVVDVAAPESVILFGAAIGGLIAFLILPQARRGLTAAPLSAHPHLGYVFIGTRAILGLFGAMLLSAIITILLARISESQFLIRVTVSDLWGAIAIGFIANYVGTEALSKIIKP